MVAVTICSDFVCVCLVMSNSLRLLGQSPPGPSVHGISQQEYWSRFPFPPPGDLLNSVIKYASPVSPALEGGFFTTWEAYSEKMKSVTASIFSPFICH